MSTSERKCAALVCAFAFLFVAGSAAADQPRSAAQLGRILAEVPEIDDVQLSPDGAWVAYSVTSKSVAANKETTRWWLQKLPEGNGALAPAVALLEGAKNIRFRPNSRSLSLTIELALLIGGDRDHDRAADDDKESGGATGFVSYDIASGEYAPLRIREAEDATTHVPLTVGEDYQWSPRGNFVAFTAPLPQTSALDPRGGVPFDDWWQSKSDSRSALYVLEAASGKVTRVTSERMNVATFGGFGWSPDERSIAVSVDHEANSQGTNTDLIVIERATGKARELVTRPGKDGHPTWSPDGRSVAFFTHDGLPSYWLGRPAVVPAAGGKIIDFGGGERHRSWWIGQSWWAPDSRSFLYVSQLEMALRMVHADVHGGTVQAIPMATTQHALPGDNHQAISADGRRMVFVRSSVTVAPQLFMVELDDRGRPVGTPRQLTALSSDFPLGRTIRTQLVQWPSPDGQFTVHGLLVTPASAWRDGRVMTPLPTAVSVPGGPAMVRRDFGLDGFHGSQLALAERGYAVLVPNTRGRGGYGDAFEQGISKGKSVLARPFEDAMAGVDKLINEGVVDPDRLAILGQSYGAMFTGYAITQTDRFKGAVVHEGPPPDFTYYLYPLEPGSWERLLARELSGVHDPADPAERASLFAQSAGFHAERIKTPTLLQFGAKSFAEEGARPFFNMLRHRGVPTACFVYDEGHSFRRPAAVADDLTRTVEWLDHWVRGIAYPDATRATQYEAWGKRR